MMNASTKSKAISSEYNLSAITVLYTAFLSVGWASTFFSHLIKSRANVSGFHQDDL